MAVDKDLADYINKMKDVLESPVIGGRGHSPTIFQPPEVCDRAQMAAASRTDEAPSRSHQPSPNMDSVIKREDNNESSGFQEGLGMSYEESKAPSPQKVSSPSPPPATIHVPIGVGGSGANPSKPGLGRGRGRGKRPPPPPPTWQQPAISGGSSLGRGKPRATPTPPPPSSYGSCGHLIQAEIAASYERSPNSTSGSSFSFCTAVEMFERRGIHD